MRRTAATAYAAGVMLDRRWAPWVLVPVFWTLLGLFFASQTYLTYLYTSGTAPLGVIVRISLSEAWVWALLTPLVLWLARRFPFVPGRRLRALAVHIPAATAVVYAKIALDVLVRQSVLGLPGRPAVVGKIHPALLTYAAIVGVRHAFAWYRAWRERELRASQLETRLAEARLQMLRMQLQPHFLFNTLHAISALVHEDPEAADRMIASLSDLLRLTLDASGPEVALRREIEIMKLYLEIQQIRFGDRLRVDLSIAPETLDARVPSLLLQPIVENAVRHGVTPRAAPGRIEIVARRQDGRLALCVRDDGPGFPGAWREGVGLSNTRARLAQRYGAAHRLALDNAPGGGASVVIEIPFDAMPPDAGGEGKEAAGRTDPGPGERGAIAAAGGPRVDIPSGPTTESGGEREGQSDPGDPPGPGGSSEREAA